MKKILLLGLFAAFSQGGWAQLRITEIMQSNVDCVMDDLNEFPDSWVEVYNPTTTSIDLANYKLGLTDDASTAYQLPSQQVGAYGFALIFCDKESTGLHTDFKLDTDEGSAVYLFENGSIVDKMTDIPEQLAPNVSYGRKNVASDELGFQYMSSPGAANTNQICTEVLGDPVFSEKGFVKTAASLTVLKLTLPEGAPEGCVIRYTTDGSEPTTSSTAYSTPIKFKATTVVRARLFCNGYISPRSKCESYIFHGRDITLPVISIASNKTYFYDNKVGIYVDGTYNSSKKNYEYDWRRPINFEYFVPTEEESVINQLGESRVAGAASRGCQLKSLAVYANKRFGKKRLKYEFFPDQKPGLDKFKSIMIRNAGNDFDYLYMRDAAVQTLMAAHTDLDWQAYHPAIFYLNGTYMGMLNVRERSNDDNIWSNYDGLEDIDMIENYGELKAGDWTEFNEFKDFYASHDHTYAEYAEQMDVVEYQNLMLMNLLFNNYDFPGNNIVQWRPRTDDGKWRWVVKDVDYIMGLYGDKATFNIIDWLYDSSYDSSHNWGANSSDATRLFRRLMEIDQFKWEFLDKVAVYTGSWLSADSVNAHLDKLAGVISYEYPFHRKLINQWWPTYSDELKKAKDWNTQRLPYFIKYLVSKYTLDGSLTGRINDQLSAEDKASVSLSINGLPLSGGCFDGKFFLNRELNIKSTCLDPTKEVKGWTLLQIGTDGHSTTTTVDGPDLTMTPKGLSLMTINAILGESTGIDEVETGRGDILYIYDTSGRRIPQFQKGINIVKYGDGSTRKIVVRD